jgi:hypothetical protein
MAVDLGDLLHDEQALARAENWQPWATELRLPIVNGSGSPDPQAP